MIRITLEMLNALSPIWKRAAGAALIGAGVMAVVAAGQTTQPMRTSATTWPSARTTYRPVNTDVPPDVITLPVAKPFPYTYSVLQSRSVFLKGRPAPVDTGGGGSRYNNGGGGTFGTETNLVFNGAEKMDESYLAFLEDTSQQKVYTVQVGQAIAMGKVTDITLDVLTYTTSGGNVRRIAIGQNLTGYSLDALATSLPTSMPADGGVAGDRIQALRLKRLQEQQKINGK